MAESWEPCQQASGHGGDSPELLLRVGTVLVGFVEVTAVARVR